MPTIEISQEQANALAAGQDVTLAAPLKRKIAVYADGTVYEIHGKQYRRIRGNNGALQLRESWRTITSDVYFSTATLINVRH